ncbi:MAG: hypothetical protein JWQ78_1945 [Sediminibacterium sp.]|jgi:hypothetical protein|nr:hypothetical protein [Sediminibacterium sp.]
MPENHLFEYAIVRIVPKVEREEFLNVGVILYCKKQNFLQTLFTLDEARICSFSGTVEVAELQEYLNAFENICKGGKAGGPIGELDIASRFRWLTAARSTVVQTSKVHPGLCENAAEALSRLYAQLVL